MPSALRIPRVATAELVCRCGLLVEPVGNQFFCQVHSIRPSVGSTQYLIAPGINYTATTYAWTVEALIPGNKATGSHVGVIAQFHLYFDDLFPHSLGKPILEW